MCGGFWPLFYSLDAEEDCTLRSGRRSYVGGNDQWSTLRAWKLLALPEAIHPWKKQLDWAQLIGCGRRWSKIPRKGRGGDAEAAFCSVSLHEGAVWLSHSFACCEVSLKGGGSNAASFSGMCVRAVIEPCICMSFLRL